MNYFSFEITPPQYSEEKGDMLTAMLSDLPFDTFEDTGHSLKAYISEEHCTPDFEQELSEIATDLDFAYIKTFIPYKNWNVLWESNFEPIQVDHFVAVRADFHAPTPAFDPLTGEGVVFDLVINPKMAFGTGHHETTYMMMQHMEQIQFEGSRVLDYGCGTGILAILASKLRAEHIEAVDIEWASYENTVENCQINQVSNVVAYHGQLDAIKTADFDIILANINRNVILDSLTQLSQKLNATNKALWGEGLLLISGFLKEDEPVMLQALNQNNFKVVKTVQRGNWLSMHLQKF